MIEPILLEDGELKHLLLKIVLLILIIVCDFGEDIGLFLLAFRGCSAYTIIVL